MLRKIVVAGLGLLVLTFHGHMETIALLVYIATAAASATGGSYTNTPMARATVQRVNGLIAANATVNTRVSNLSGQATGTGLPAGTPTSDPNVSLTGAAFTSTSSSYPTGTTSSALSGSNAHTHDYGGHYHDFTHTHDFDGHTHDLPVV